jgi:predicted RNase H-like nuclease (RuvC/YqgF family)
MEGRRFPLTVVSNEHKISSSPKHKYPTRSSSSSQESCAECKVNYHRIEDLQIALSEVLNQNSALKVRVVELEAELNQAQDELEAGRRRRGEDSKTKARRVSSKM